VLLVGTDVAICSSETSVPTGTTRCYHIPEDSILYLHCFMVRCLAMTMNIFMQPFPINGCISWFHSSRQCTVFRTCLKAETIGRVHLYNFQCSSFHAERVVSHECIFRSMHNHSRVA
jgi:hypothetical protein